MNDFLIIRAQCEHTKSKVIKTHTNKENEKKDAQTAGGSGANIAVLGSGDGDIVSSVDAFISSLSYYKGISRERSTDKISLRSAQSKDNQSNSDNPSWLFCLYETNLYTYKSFHIEFHWAVCDSWLINEFITVLYRKCKAWDLRLCQVPDYF